MKKRHFLVREITFHCMGNATSFIINLFPVREHFIPSMGMFCSQGGNIFFKVSLCPLVLVLLHHNS